MAKSAIRYRKSTGQHGTMVIREIGRCMSGDINGIESGCCRRFELVPLPAASGVIMKPMDGSSPSPTNVSLAGSGQNYSCVKIEAIVNPFAPEQDGGPFNAQYVYEYEITWQEVGGVA